MLADRNSCSQQYRVRRPDHVRDVVDVHRVDADESGAGIQARRSVFDVHGTRCDRCATCDGSGSGARSRRREGAIIHRDRPGVGNPSRGALIRCAGESLQRSA